MPAKYLPHLPKPLLDDLVSGRWLPVIGAGMSLNAVLPPPLKMPLWSDLSKQFAEELREVLAEAFAELREYRRDHAASTLKPTEQRPLEQLLLPRDAVSRLCFFSLPLDVLPFYRDRIFPLAEAVGLVPVTGADVINVGDSISAKIDTLIDRAAVMVVDLSSQNTLSEFALAVSRTKENGWPPNRPRLRIIPIAARLEDLPSSVLEFQILRRPEVLSEDNDDFVQQLEQVFQRVATEIGIAQDAEPRRLFKAKEYRAAVIAAMTLLEAELRHHGLYKVPASELQRSISFRHLLSRISHPEIDDVYREKILGWYKLRSEAVHKGKLVHRNEAQAVVEGVERLLNILRRN